VIQSPSALCAYHQFSAASLTPVKIGRLTVTKMIGNQTIDARMYHTLT